jgi:hypothetical protein
MGFEYHTDHNEKVGRSLELAISHIPHTSHHRPVPWESGAQTVHPHPKKYCLVNNYMCQIHQDVIFAPRIPWLFNIRIYAPLLYLNIHL